MDDSVDVIVIGGGPAGLTAATFTTRAGLATTVFDRGDSILRRNAHLQNFPGFPDGVDARLLLSWQGDAVRQAGGTIREETISRLTRRDERFVARTDDGAAVDAAWVICATKNEVGYLAGLDDVEIRDQGKTFVETDERGRTAVPGLYAAGRLAGKPHQAVVAAGHGAEVAVTLLEDADRPFYHDWVTPAGYFTGRDRAVPPGCVELDPAERQERTRASIEAMRARLDDPPLEPPDQHPSVATDGE